MVFLDHAQMNVFNPDRIVEARELISRRKRTAPEW